MMAIARLGELLGVDALTAYVDHRSRFTDRDEIERQLADNLVTRTTAWLALPEPADVWCAGQPTWPRLFGHEGFQALAMSKPCDARTAPRSSPPAAQFESTARS
jgi:crotonobetainyl-CoA:carnitine CoA-transferase CaiB-like acyl-CoA transferase